MNAFQRVVLTVALAAAAGMALAPPYEGLRPLGGGQFSEELESIGHRPVFAAAPTAQVKGDFVDQVLARQREGTNIAEPELVAALQKGTIAEPWRRVNVAWVRFGCEFAALVFVTLLLLVAGNLFAKSQQTTTGAT